MFSKSQIKSVVYAFLPACVLVLAGCPSVPPFTEGIRVLADEQVTGVSNSNFPLPNVSVSGNTTAPPGPGNTGNVTGFTNSTNSLGYFDEPQATTSTTWNFSAYFGNSPVADEGCPPAGQNNYPVPPQGAIVTVVCFVFTS